jgi:predicted DsbA family dithiol-disulfide isomerase
MAMHDLLFARQDEWGSNNAVDIFTGYAEELGLDSSVFRTCLESDRHQEAIQADLQEGSQLGIRGTPAFFINGHFLSGAQPYQVFEQAIEQLAADAE